MGACGSMPLVDVVNLTEGYRTGTAVLDSISYQAICEDLEVRLGWRKGFVAKGLSAEMMTFSCQVV